MVRSRVSVCWALALLAGCEPEIGSPCDVNQAEVDKLVPPKEGTNNLVQDVGFDNCNQGFCLSVDGSRGFCTKKCESDRECAEAGDGFLCQEAVVFGPLACLDYEDPLLARPDTEPSGQTCEEGVVCPDAESCFSEGTLTNTCGVPGRDCLTGDNGGKSPNPTRYCAASPDVLVARDEQFGRAQ